MNHPNDDRLLLLAYGELPEAEAAEIETHLAACIDCRQQLVGFERQRAALAFAVPGRPTRALPWMGATLAAAAALTAVLIAISRSGDDGRQGWQPPSVWSATAGYIAGGAPVVEIDAQLTRLEQEKADGFPN
jgi:anti-sigma factor RsiW